MGIEDNLKREEITVRTTSKNEKKRNERNSTSTFHYNKHLISCPSF